MEKKWTIDRIKRWMKKGAVLNPMPHRPDYARILSIEHAINGEESFAKPMLDELFIRLVNNQLDEIDHAALAVILWRLTDSIDSQKAICGVEGRGGQKRRGAEGFEIAQKVAELIQTGSKAQDAWIEVGRREHLGKSAVQGHWSKWKPELFAICKEATRPMLPPETSESELDAFARCTVLGKGAKASDSMIVERVKRRLAKSIDQSSGPDD